MIQKKSVLCPECLGNGILLGRWKPKEPARRARRCGVCNGAGISLKKARRAQAGTRP